MYATCESVDLFEKEFYDRISMKINTLLKDFHDINHYEIFCNANQDTKITYEKGNIKDATQKSGGGLGLRIIGSEGREGTTFTSDFSDSALELVAYHAVKMMKAATPNPFFVNLASPSKLYTKIDGTYDPEIVNICPDDIDSIIKPLLNLKDRPITPQSLSGSFSSSFGTVYISNSNGIHQWEKYTTAGCNVECSLISNDSPSNGFDWQTVCQLKDLNVSKIADRCYNMAYRGLQKRTIPSGEYPMILSPLAVASFLITPITHAINAERVLNQMSFLGNDINESIGSKSLTLRDNPHLPCKIGTESFDAEGIATQPLTIVENGVLKEFYHNTLTASKAKTQSNGHASRGSYSNSIGVGNYNIIMENGSTSFENMIQGVEKGIFLEYSGDSPNYISGDFSGLIMTGYLIENGEIGPALLETLMSINLKDAYSSIGDISKERVWVDEIYAPSVKLDSVVISGRD